jgi:hypothetical protein
VRFLVLLPLPSPHLGAEAAADRALVLELTEQVRDRVQQAVYANVVRRGPAFV